MARGEGGIGETAVVVGGVLIVLLLVVVVASPLAGLILSQTEETREFEPAVNQSTELSGDDEVPGGFEVEATTEQAVSFEGSGYVAGGEPVGWSDDDWTVCLVASLSPEANTEATYSAFAYDNETILIEWQAGDWRAVHRSGGQSAVATVTAEAGEEAVCASWTETAAELELRVGGDRNDTASLSSSAAGLSVAHDWYGWIDEVRLINASVDSGVADAYAADPIDPLASVEHDARYMLDEGEGTGTKVYYHGGSAEVVGGSWTDGVDGPALAHGEDYSLEVGPLRISALDGGYLDGAPVAYVTWPGNPIAQAFAELMSTMAVALSLVVIALLALAASRVLDGFGGGR